MTRFVTAAATMLVLAGATIAQPNATRPKPAPTRAAAPQAPPGQSPDVQAMVNRAIAYLKAQQDAKTGGWAINPKGPSFPAITGLAMTGMLMDPATKDGDPAIQNGLKYILSNQQPDGGIYDQILPSYNTSICLSALARIKPTKETNDAIKKAQTFLKSIQFGEAAVDGVGK